ncbi:hypothetical protein [Mesorhizobium sophorae]|uniref:hypothetical protein n=1 Tax=Mesorhizobium sophorae TaxID=1300294 RepID=UPI00117D9CDC|nr:hypothetical protein [Mesorhizobium sophorae]
MASKHGVRGDDGSEPRPVGWRAILSPKISRRGFLLASATLPLAPEVTLADSNDKSDTTIEFDLSSDGSRLNIREFPVDRDKRENRSLNWNWETKAESYGPAAWFDIVVDARDDEKRSLWVRDASLGGASPMAFEFQFRHISPDTPGGYWAFRLKAPLGGAAGGPWISDQVPFRNFAIIDAGSVPLRGFIDQDRAGKWLTQMFDERVSVAKKTNDPPLLEFDASGVWHLSRPASPAVNAFSGRVTAKHLCIGWFFQDQKEPFFLGTTNCAGAVVDKGSVAIPASFVLGQAKKLRIRIVGDPSDGHAELEVRRIRSPLVRDSGALTTYAKLTFGKSRLTVLDGNSVTAESLLTEALFVTEWRMPGTDRRLRNALWGQVAHATQEADQANGLESLLTQAGRLKVNGLTPARTSEAEAAVLDTASVAAAVDPSALAAIGDRSGVLDASIWAVFDQAKTGGDFAARRIAIDLELHASDLALPDASYSTLRFDVADPTGYGDLRLVYEDGQAIPELFAGEYPRRRPSSFVWLGAVDQGQQIASFDLTRATLAVCRDRDLIDLRFRFLDLAVAVTKGEKPVIYPAHKDCRVIETEPGRFSDNRPVLVAEFNPQHVFEEAVFGQMTPLPDVVATPPDPDLDRSAIFQKLAEYAGDVKALAEYRKVIQKKKIDIAPTDAFSKFCYSYASDPYVKKLPADQQVYIGPFALDPDAMALARRVALKLANETVSESIDAVFKRVSSVAENSRSSKPDYWLPISDAEITPPLSAKEYLENALRNENVLEQSEPIYGVFRDFYRDQMLRAYNYATSRTGPVPPFPSALWPISMDKGEVEFLSKYNRPVAADDDDGSLRGKRQTALRKLYVDNIAGADPNEFKELTEGRLAGPTRLAFRINCMPTAGANAEDAGLPHFSGAAPSAPGGGGFDYPPLEYSFEALTNWSRHEPAVTLRARKLFTAAPDGIVPPIGERAANLDDGDVLTFQGLSRHPVTAEQRLGEIRAALANKPTMFETAIEIPARLILSTAQDAIWLNRYEPPWQVVQGKYDATGPDPQPPRPDNLIMKPADAVARARASLWTARLDIDAIEPNLRVVDSPDLRPNALTWLKPVGDPRQIGQGEPPHGSLAPWFLGPEQMDETTLTAGNVNQSLPEASRIRSGNPPQDVTEADLCAPKGPWRDRIWNVLRRLCDRSDARNALNGSQYFLNALDAYDRHELVLLSSAYGLPVIGKRGISDTGQPGALVPDSGQIEPGDEFAVLDADGAQAIQRPQPLRAQQLELSALGAFFVHDTHFSPSAGADNLWGGKVFNGFSIERWRSEIVVGRDIVGEVVYKGYLFPLGHRASLVKLTERLFLRNETLGVKAVLFQRIFLRIGRKTQLYPCVGQPFDGRLWCASDVTIRTLQTPDLRDPYDKGPAGSPTPENLSGGRIDIGPNPGLAFWPRVNETDEGLVKFDLTIDGATTSMPLVFVDNIAATNAASLGALASVYLSTSQWLPRRTVALGDQHIRFASETKSGDCSFKTMKLVLSVTGQVANLTSAWVGDLTKFQTNSILEGAEQPSFYPALETATIRLTQKERLAGGHPAYVDTQYDGRYARFGFARPATEPTTNPLEIYLNLRIAEIMAMGDNGERAAAVGRPAGLIVAMGRKNGPVSASGNIQYETAAPVSEDSHNGGGVMVVNADALALIPDPEKAATPPTNFGQLVSLADFFDPKAHYIGQAAASLPAIRNPAGVPAQKARAARVVDDRFADIRNVLKVFFSEDAKLLGIISFRKLLDFLGFDIPTLSDATPTLRETLQFGADVLSDQDADKLTQFTHSQILAPLRAVVSTFQDQWLRADDLIKGQAGGNIFNLAEVFRHAVTTLASGKAGGNMLSLAKVFPEISNGLADLDTKLARAEKDDDPVTLALDLTEVYESAKSFASALDRIASNPVARLKQAAIAVLQRQLTALADAQGPLTQALQGLETVVDTELSAGAANLKAWIKASIPDTGKDDVEDGSTYSMPAPQLVDLAEAFEAGTGTLIQPIQDKLVGAIRLDIRDFASAAVGAYLKNDSITLGSFIADVKQDIDKTIETAIKDASSNIDAQIKGTKPALAAYLNEYLAYFIDRELKSFQDLPILLTNIYAAYEMFSDAVRLLSQFRDHVKRGGIGDAVDDICQLADQMFGFGDAGIANTTIAEARGKLNDVFKAAQAQFDMAASALLPSDTTAFAAEKAACWNYAIAGKPLGVLPMPNPPAVSGVMQPVDQMLASMQALVDKIKGVEQALDTKVAGSGLPLRTAIDNAAPSAGYTQFIDNFAVFLLGGGSPSPLGLTGEIAAMYCDFVRDLALLQKSRDLVAATTFATANKALADALLQYQRDASALVSNAIGHIASIGSMVSSFIKANSDIVNNVGIYVAIGAVTSIVDGMGGNVDSGAKQVFDKLRADIEAIEKSLATWGAGAINSIVTILNSSSVFSKTLYDAANTLQSDIVAPLHGIGLDLDPQQTHANAALAALKAAIEKSGGFKPIPTPLPTSLAGLLAAPISSVPPVTVQTLLDDPKGQLGDLLTNLCNTGAMLVAEWRALQARASGWPVFLQQAALKLGPMQATLQAMFKSYGTLHTIRNSAAETINIPLLSLRARRSVFVQPVYGLLTPVDVINAPDDNATLAVLEANDRLAEEVRLLSDIVSYPSSPPSPDTILANFARFANSWRAADITQRAAPLQIATQIGDLAVEVLKGEVLSLIDVSALRDALLDAIARLIPTKALFSYEFDSYVSEEPHASDIFQAAVGTRFALRTAIEVDLLNGGSPQISTNGSLGPFAVKLVGDYLDAMTLHFGGLAFTSQGGSAPRFDVMYDAYNLGSDLAFFALLGPVLSPDSGSPVQISPLQRTRGLDVGYDVNLGSISIGPVSIFNINFAVSAELPFTDQQALFKASLGTRLTPLTISFLPYAGSGYFSIYAGPGGIVGFEASFLFGAGGSLDFGPLHAQVQIQVGAFIRVMKVDGINQTEIGGSFLAAGQASIWIFHFSATLYIGLSQNITTRQMHGEAIFTFSFSCGLIDYNYSVTGQHDQQQFGGSQHSVARQLGPMAAPMKSPPADVVSTAVCLSEDWGAFASYFDFSLV